MVRYLVRWPFSFGRNSFCKRLGPCLVLVAALAAVMESLVSRVSVS